MRIRDWSSDVCSSDLGDLYRELRDRDLRQLSSLTLAMAESIANTVGPLLVAEQRTLAKRWRIWAGISPDNHAALLNHSVDAVVTTTDRSEEHTSELQSLMRLSYAVFCLKKKKSPY